MSEDTRLLRMEQISKAFPGVQALDEVDFTAQRGEIHALVGENGAGKSTLMKVLTGALTADLGKILWRGQEVQINTPSDAQALGISMIHQELSLIPYLTVGQNVFLGREPQRRITGFIDWGRLYERTSALLTRLNLDVDPRARVEALSIAQQQMVEVAKALSLNADLIVMDEPTSSLTDVETEILFDVMRALREEGVAIIFISHRLEEVFEISDRITILRDGHHIATKSTAALSQAQVVEFMVGRELGEMYPYSPTEQRSVVLEARDLGSGDELQQVSFQVHGGEILGVAGLIGAGRTALAECLFGIRPADRGQVVLAGEAVHIGSPGHAIDLGLGFVPEDRKLQGLFLDMAVRENVIMSAMGQVSTLGFVSRSAVNDLSSEFVDKLDIRTPSLRQRVRNLSGGNQQKVIIARWLTLHPRVLILDEPTRGVDVGAKAEIHGLMRNLAEDGVAVLMISSELPEVLGVSDRIIVMHEGRITGRLSRDEATQDKIMLAATGGENHAV
ncbi:MAG: sugar ABC transporter ATP-binding protein [Candidatus Promineifilaceae bacterium]|nr:sugar ABC transporter ATP-binding protein [Candidatus Promineifilaceae bacterium]